MVAAWGAVLLMGVTDPLGGINTLFPLFGIANQLLAAIALAIVLAIVAKRRTFSQLWVVALPLAFVTVITVTASLFKIFSPVPQVGYWANHLAFRGALAAGETTFGSATSVQAMEAVVRNTFVQGTLSIIFLVLTLVVIAFSILNVINAFRRADVVDQEEERRESAMFAPAGFIPTPEERELQKRWDAVPDEHKHVPVGH
jgi:carbon starvation protein